MASDQNIEADVQYVMTRKRKRPAYDSQGEGDLDSLLFESSMDMREPSLGLIPPIVTLNPARNTTTTRLNHHQEAVSVDKFIRRVIAEVPGRQRKRKLRTVQLQDTSISPTGGANIQPVTPPVRAKVYPCNGGRISKKPARARIPMTLTQRLARAAMLSHVETNEILDSPAISSSRRPLDFVPFQKFATPPSSPKKTLVNRSASSGVGSSSGARLPSEASAVMLRGNRRQTRKQPTSERPDCPPLIFVPTREAEAAYAAMFPRRQKQTQKQTQQPKPTSERPGCPPLTFVPEHEAKAAYAAMFPQKQTQKPKPTSESPGCPPLTFVPEHEARAAYAAMFPRRQKRKLTTERPDCPPLTFVPEHKAKAAYAAMFPRRKTQQPTPQPTSERSGCPPLAFIPTREAEATHAAKFSRS